MKYNLYAYIPLALHLIPLLCEPGDIDIFKSTPSIQQINLTRTKCHGIVYRYIYLSLILPSYYCLLELHVYCTSDIKLFWYTAGVKEFKLTATKCYG
jgi:hypothetical protein